MEEEDEEKKGIRRKVDDFLSVETILICVYVIFYRWDVEDEQRKADNSTQKGRAINANVFLLSCGKMNKNKRSMGKLATKGGYPTERQLGTKDKRERVRKRGRDKEEQNKDGYGSCVSSEGRSVRAF